MPINLPGLIFLGRAGSHLHGTTTPKSDEDFKGVYVPPLSDCILGNVRNSIKFDTNKANVHGEIYSIQKFLNLAKNSDTTAIEMLFTNSENVLYNSREWETLVFHRRSFFTADMKRFAGYAKSQSLIYGDKLMSVAGILRSKPPSDRVGIYFPELPDVKNDGGQVDICGKIIHATVSVKYALDIINNAISKFGDRVKLKSLSHAIRIVTELEEIYTRGVITFPLVNAEYIRDVKLGRVPEKVAVADFNRIYDNVKKMAKKSKFVAEVPNTFVNSLILSFYNQ